MIYECDKCDSVLSPGMTICPNCGERFDDPVPADAESVSDAAPRSVRSKIPLAAIVVAAVLVLSLVAWVGHRHSAPPLADNSAVSSRAYAATMQAFVRQLRSTGVEAQWPAFGSDDVLLITPPVSVSGKRAVWDQTAYENLAQGIYGFFRQTRSRSGFSDNDAAACYVIVEDPHGHNVAVDLMGGVD